MNLDPYSPPPDRPPAPAESQVVSRPVQVDARPRVWPIPIVLLISFGAYLGVSILAMLLAAWIVQDPVEGPFFGEHGRFAAVTQSPLGLAIMLVLPQLAMVTPAVIAAIASPLPTAERLGLVRGHWPIWLWCTAALATPLVGMISSAIVSALLGESETLDEMAGVFRLLAEDGYLIPLALLVGVTPAICEELVFRGYMQSRMTSAWGAPLGILSTSAIFAVFHMDLVHSVAVIALGIYLGWIAWASGSILTAMLAHFLNNFLSVLAVVLLPESAADAVPVAAEDIPTTAVAVLGGVVVLSGACLVVTLFHGIRRTRRPTIRTDESENLSKSAGRN